MGSLHKLKPKKSPRSQVTAIRNDMVRRGSKQMPTAGAYSGLAREVGVSASYISLVFRGLRDPSADMLMKLAAQLKMDPKRLYQELKTLQENAK